MCEAISLAGAMESPLVIHLGQRPGPATGLPTRTEQADLNLALYAGHGEFPRAIFAPSSIESCYYLAQKSFCLADKYQIPVIILTNQHLLDSFYPVNEIKFEKIEDFIIKTEKDYLRYKFTENGISPRGIPQFGEGLVVFDSHEHDEGGHITELEDLRKKMVEKRNLKDTAILHFEQVWPINKVAKEFAKKAKKILIIEGNYSSQFERLFHFETDKRADEKLLKYSGSPFSIEDIEEFLKEVL